MSSPEHATTIRYPTSAQLCLDSADRIDPKATLQQNSYQRYNNFTITKNQNLIQGAFKRVTLSEIRFPYAIPNINPRNNTLLIAFGDSTTLANPVYLPITINEGFYTGAELATALTTAITSLEYNGNPYPYASTMTCTWNDKNASGKDGAFIFASSQQGTATDYIYLFIKGNPANGDYQDQFLSLLGMAQPFIPTTYDCRTPFIPAGETASSGAPLETGVAPLIYTSYIDIVSQQLTNFQRVKDTSTQATIPRLGILYRLFIVDEASENNPDLIFGTFPFTIYRKLVIPKVIRWSGEHAIGQIDISLYDQFGEPLYIPKQIAYLPVPFAPGYAEEFFDVPQQDFQLTFICSEE